MGLEMVKKGTSAHFPNVTLETHSLVSKRPFQTLIELRSSLIALTKASLTHISLHCNPSAHFYDRAIYFK